MNALKEELKELIDQQEDQNLLEEIKSLLTEKQLDPAMKEFMVRRAMQADEDIKAGRIHTLEESKEIIEAYRKSVYPEK